MKYIVTGGAGFIGSHLVEKLLVNKHQVVVVDDFSTGFKRFLPDNKNLQVIEVDISDWGELSKNSSYFKDADGVFHLAAKARIQPSILSPHRTHDCNITGTLNILEMMRMCDIKSIVYSASSSSYGLVPELPCVETAEADCQTPYALSKYVGELYCKTWSKLHGIRSVCLKYFNVFGRRSPLQGPYAPVIGLFLRQGFLNQPITVIGDGEQKRDFTHVSDVASANILAMESEIDGLTINIGTGKNHTINEVAGLVQASLARLKETTRIYLPERIGETQETLADNTRAKELLKWTPNVYLAEGINDLVKYYSDNIEELSKARPVL